MKSGEAIVFLLLGYIRAMKESCRETKLFRIANSSKKSESLAREVLKTLGRQAAFVCATDRMATSSGIRFPSDCTARMTPSAIRSVAQTNAACRPSVFKTSLARGLGEREVVFFGIDLDEPFERSREQGYIRAMKESCRETKLFRIANSSKKSESSPEYTPVLLSVRMAHPNQCRKRQPHAPPAP